MPAPRPSSRQLDFTHLFFVMLGDIMARARARHLQFSLYDEVAVQWALREILPRCCSLHQRRACAGWVSRNSLSLVCGARARAPLSTPLCLAESHSLRRGLCGKSFRACPTCIMFDWLRAGFASPPNRRVYARARAQYCALSGQFLGRDLVVNWSRRKIPANGCYNYR